MTTFWLSFIVQEAIGVAAAYVQTANIKPGLKSALEQMILAGQGVAAAIQSGQ